MTQSLLHWVSSPLGLLALLLWISLALLTFRQCRRWAKERRRERVVYQNHPSIPVKVYAQNNTKSLERIIPNNRKMSTQSQTKEDTTIPSPNAWDV